MFDHAHFPKWLNYYREEESQQLFVDHLGWSHPEQMVTNCRMGAGVGHWEPPQTKGCQNLIKQMVTNCRMGAGVVHRELPQTKGCQNLIKQMVTNCRMGAGVVHRELPQTKGCQNLINIQTTAVTTGATSFTWRVVNWKYIKGLNLGCSGFIPTPVNPRYYMCFVTAMLQ